MEKAPSGLMQTLDSLTSYTLAFFVLAFTAILENAGGIMTVGGLILLGLRLYVDWVKARQTYRDHNEWKKGQRNDRESS